MVHKFNLFVATIIVIILNIFQYVQCDGHYSIVGSKQIRPNSDYHVSVSVHDQTEPCEMRLTIQNDKDYKLMKDITVQPYTTQIVEFQTGEMTPGSTNYKLMAEGLTGIKFKNETTINLNEKSFSVFTQTDKAIYKPGDKIRFRVLVLDSNTKPFELKGDMLVYIIDGSQNRIKQWPKAKSVRGVFSEELQLSNFPVLGDWTIVVTVMGETHRKTIEVAEYVLPKFEVIIDSPKNQIYKDEKIRATIRGKYTYGKPVRGEATVSIQPKFYGGYQPLVDGLVNRKVIKIDGKGFVEFDMKNDLKIDQEYQREFDIEAIVEEELTGRKQTGKLTITLHKDKYTIRKINDKNNYKPGLPLDIIVQVAHHDGTPVIDKVNKLKISYSENWNHENSTVQEYPLDKNGQAFITLILPYSNDTYHSVNVKADYLGLSEGIGYFNQDKSTSGVYLQANLNDGPPKINKEVTVDVMCTEKMSYLTYQILGRGDILVSNTISVPDSDRHSFKFLATFAMVPKAKIIIYFIKNGELISDKLELEFTNELQNQITVDTSTEQAKPGQDIDITISTRPNSYVGLLGVDQSVMLLKSGNDLSKEDVFSQLDEYNRDYYRPIFYNPGIRPIPFFGGFNPVEDVATTTDASNDESETTEVLSRKRRYYPYEPIWEDFDNAGAVLMTNAKEIDRTYDYHADEEFILAEVQDGAISEDNLSGGQLPSDTLLVIRKDFPETWIWELYDISKSNDRVKWAVGGGVSNIKGLIYRSRFAIDSDHIRLLSAAGPIMARGQIAYSMPVARFQPKTFVKPELKVRKEFPETWIWDEISSENQTGFDGHQVLHKKVPDTITSWLITGFSIDPVTGLGLTKSPTKLQVFQPFFVSLNLPYSIKRGEIVSIPIVVFNYMDEAVSAEVTLHNEDQAFEFAEATNEVNATPKIELYRRKRVAIKSNDGTATSFMIKPKKVGPITIKVTATSPLAGDGIERILPVEAEGSPQFINQAMFIDLRDETSVKSNMTIEIPKNAVPDSTRIEASVVGDIMGVTMKNLDSLIRMPFGCGEQNMINFVPNIVVINYLKNSNQLNPALKAKATNFMESGYQRELTYRHDDGSFSAFGKSDDSGSTWLTAFVAKSFNQAAEHIDVEDSVIDRSLEWLAKVQAKNGSFPEVGKVSHTDMQGGAGQGIALTAYTLITFLENSAKIPTYRNTINKAMDYIVRNLENTNDVYALALAAYALQLSDHNAKDLIYQKLHMRAKVVADKKWWDKPVPESESNSIWHSKPNSVNTEMTAYGLLTTLAAGHVTDGLPIMKWLLSQRNDQGGFDSTQDTVVGLQALAKFAEHISSKDNNVQVTLNYGDGAETKMNVNAENSVINQQYELPSNIRKMNISASGHGFALFQLSHRYNLNVTGAWPRFTLDPKVNKNSNQDYLQLTVCASFIPAGDEKVSNMAVMEVEFPSGFTADIDRIPSIESSENVKKVETKNGDTVVVIYFDNLSAKELCPTLDAFRTHKVAKQRPAPVLVYDYYDTARRARMFYETQEASICDICEGEDCGEACKITAEKQQLSSTNSEDDIWKSLDQGPRSSAGSVLASCFVVVFTIFFSQL